MTPSKSNKDALGRGIRALLNNIDGNLQTADGNLKSEVVQKVTESVRIPVGDIQENPKQPRKDFDEVAMEELATSIKMHDIIQPLTVTKLPNGKYQIIAGERRLRAAKLAGLADVPVYVREANDQQLLELALLENLQRENLNAIEIALSYRRMMEELSFTQEQVADRMGKERATVTNYIRLLKLPPDIQFSVRNGTLSMGHARALINIDKVDKQLYAFQQIKEKGLNVRQTEDLVRNMYKEKENESPKANKLPPAFKKIEDTIASHFSTKVKMQHNKDGKGSITMEYYSLDELNKLLAQMNIMVS